MEVRRYSIWERLRVRLKLEDFGLFQRKFVAMTIQPVTSVDDLVQTRSVYDQVLDVSAGGVFAFFTVPVGKRWRLKAFVISATVGLSAVMVGASLTNYIVITTATAALKLDAHLDLKLESGWIVGISNSANVADTAVQMKVLVDEEDA